MSYLLDLLKSFDESELGQLRSIELLGKESAVRDEYANNVRNKKFSEPALPAKLKLTKSHFDKINSVLLDKALTHFAGDGLKDKLDFLVRKQLYGLVLHELKLNERKIKKSNDKSAVKEFYQLAFRITMLFNFNNFPEEELEYYANSYTQLLSAKETAEKYIILAKHQEMLIRYYSSRKNGKRKKDSALKKILQWQGEITDKKLYEVEVGINMALSAYYESVENEKSLHYLQQADATARKVYDKISERDKAFLLAMIAQQLIDLSRYEEGIASYGELFLKFPVLAGARMYHPYQYVFALLIIKDLKRAADALKKYIEPFLKNENARNLHFDILRLYAIYYLLNGETDEAGNCLQRIMQFGKEDFTPLGDVLFRLVHNVYCAQTGDYALATDVLKKNIKFIDSKIDIEGFTIYKKFFVDLGRIIRYKTKNDPGRPFPLDELYPSEGRARLYVELIKLPLGK